jgi:NAD dependent epimerase/dehydratase
MSGFFAGKTVLVTGAGGFIGSHLVEALVAQGARVRALVHYNSRNDWGLLDVLPAGARGAVAVTAGDVRDPFLVRGLVDGCSHVFHLAALIGIPYSYLAPQSYVETNITGTLNVLEACRQCGVERLVHTSTSEAYGTARYTPIDEAHPLQGQSPYSASKIGADKLAESYHLSFNLPVATLRPFNNFGPRQSLRAVIPTIIGQALAEPAIRLGALDPLRDFLYAGDTARAFLLAAEKPAAVGQVINAGSGKSISIGQLATRILQRMGVDKPVECTDERVRPPHSEVLRLECDATRARELLGWTPRVGLDEGLDHTIAWMREHRARFKTGAYVV